MRWIRRAIMGKVAHWGWRNRSMIMSKVKSLFGGGSSGKGGGKGGGRSRRTASSRA